MQEARTKIVATVGPASAEPSVLKAMIRNGADVFRINGSHADISEIGPWIRRIRAAATSVGTPVAVMVDLPGTKIRIGRFKAGDHVELSTGAKVRLFAGRTGGTAQHIPVVSLRHVDAIEKGQSVWMADGQLRLRVIRVDGKELICRVEAGGLLKSGKGIDFPGARLPTKVPTARDKRIAKVAIDAHVDMLALSFVRDLSDIERMKRFLKAQGVPDLPVVAKIEREDAIENLDAILSRAEIALVARGDLGVDVGPERVPTFQRRILEAAARNGRAAIVATEMLESMVTNVRPTRAEASDVANAVFEMADGVMLSAESAVGHNPAMVVKTMNRILVAAEADPAAPYAGSVGFPGPQVIPGRGDQHVVHAAVTLAAKTDAAALVVFTRQGSSAFRVSKERPRAPIFAFGPSDDVSRYLSMAWGVRPRRLPRHKSTDAVIARVLERLRDEENLPPGARAVLVMGGADDPAGTTTLIKLLTL